MPGAFHPIASPVGDLGAVFDDEGKLLQLIRFHGVPPEEPTDPAPKCLPFLKRQLESYFSGNLRDFNIPIHMEGTDFQRRVWATLRQIPYGETWSYGELARHLGNPGASRAVGLANGRNPVGIIVPCHRVVGADGSLTGYAGGVDRKRLLLQLEQHRAQLPLG